MNLIPITKLVLICDIVLDLKIIHVFTTYDISYKELSLVVKEYISVSSSVMFYCRNTFNH